MIDQRTPLRAVSHPALLALNGGTFRIETQTAADGGTCIFLHDPNTGAMVAQLGLTDATNGRTHAHCGIRCNAREQGASYKREGER